MSLRPNPLTRKMTVAVIIYLLLILTTVFFRPFRTTPDWILVGLCSLAILLMFFESKPPNGIDRQRATLKLTIIISGFVSLGCAITNIIYDVPKPYEHSFSLLRTLAFVTFVLSLLKLSALLKKPRQDITEKKEEALRG